MTPLSNARLEAAALAVGRALGFVYSGNKPLLDQLDNPRIAHWVTLARAALAARPSRRRSSRARAARS